MRRASICRYKEGCMSRVKDSIAEEALLHLEINKEAAFDTICTPTDVKEFAVGNLFAEGFIRSVDEIMSIKRKKKNDAIYVDVTLRRFDQKKTFLKKNYNIIWTECGPPVNFRKRIGDRLKNAEAPFTLTPRALFDAQEKVMMHSRAFQETGAEHYAFLFDPSGRLLTWSMDVGRHNAVDKVIGKHLLAKRSFADTWLFSTGRLSSDLVFKALRARIPLVVSKSAPLASAVDIAREYGLGLIGFLRGQRFNLYSGEKMISLERGGRSA
ncbi:MAG: formate dehydrogenase accessory sulfurtransferase FdhD [Euryarchaeota archaeon]|nr:formate dehydrogenase accessory sulfurtransferase FdhD [Euryarchaeota archaeon]